MYENLSIERQLEQAGVALLAWNEPIKVDFRRDARPGGRFRAPGPCAVTATTRVETHGPAFHTVTVIMAGH